MRRHDEAGRNIKRLQTHLGHEHSAGKGRRPFTTFLDDEILNMKKQLEAFTGNKITRKSLKEAIETTQKATRVFRRLQDLRKGNPVIMGRDAMLVNQAYLWDDKERWTQKAEALSTSLEEGQRKDWVCRLTHLEL